MIRNDTEYQQAVRRLADERARLEEHASRLRTRGLSPDEVRHALEPLQSFQLLLQDEIESYDGLKRGELPELSNLHGLGAALIGYRIASGSTQRDLAEKLGIHESQVSRDERNEYHGVTVEKASRILDALNANLRCTFHPRSETAYPSDPPPLPEFVGALNEPNAAASPTRGAVWVEEKPNTKLGFIENPANVRRSGSGTTATTSRSLTTKRAA
jgi:transcriptional regulator with XRE-family HTH domain